MRNTSIYILCVTVFVSFLSGFSEGKACCWLCWGREEDDRKEKEMRVIKKSSSRLVTLDHDHIPYHRLEDKGADPLAPNTKTWGFPRT